ncbi:Beta-xylosidase [Paenibacillus sp. P1XP2]|nr:Beta-xylosidase [Paenibacillus sp. P1XP2]
MAVTAARGVIKNPILKGFNPDPCILRVDDMYYIAVSSFEWLPGIRVYRSRDLASWEHFTDLLTDQVDLRGNPKNCSIWRRSSATATAFFTCCTPT